MPPDVDVPLSAFLAVFTAVVAFVLILLYRNLRLASLDTGQKFYFWATIALAGTIVLALGGRVAYLTAASSSTRAMTPISDALPPQTPEPMEEPPTPALKEESGAAVASLGAVPEVSFTSAEDSSRTDHKGTTSTHGPRPNKAESWDILTALLDRELAKTSLPGFYTLPCCQTKLDKSTLYGPSKSTTYVELNDTKPATEPSNGLISSIVAAAMVGGIGGLYGREQTNSLDQGYPSLDFGDEDRMKRLINELVESNIRLQAELDAVKAEKRLQ